MSSNTYGYAISLQQLKDCFGNESLMDDLVSKNQHELTESRREAVAAILCQNWESQKIAPESLAYGVEELCRHVGSQLSGTVHSIEDLEWDIDTQDLTQTLELPSVSDFPFTSFVPLEYLKLQFDVLNEQTEHEDGEVYDNRENFVWWMQQCIEMNTDLVMYCY